MATHKYESASENSDFPTLPVPDTTDRRRADRSRRVCTWLFGFFAVTGIAVIYVLEMLDYGKKPGSIQLAGFRQPEECGMSPAEARQLGCIFDVVTMSWTPKRCHDDTLSADFLVERDWKFFAHANLTAPFFSAREIAQGEWSHIYVDNEFHVFHCIYLWHKTQRAMTRGVEVDGYTADPHVVNHCAATILDENFATPDVYMKYSVCPWVPSDSGRLGWYRVIGDRKLHRQP